MWDDTEEIEKRMERRLSKRFGVTSEQATVMSSIAIIIFLFLYFTLGIDEENPGLFDLAFIVIGFICIVGPFGIPEPKRRR